MQFKGLKIKCCSRLHLSLLSMHDTGLRINGGVGFAIELPAIIINAKPSHSFAINDNRKFGLSNEAKMGLLNILELTRKYYSLHQAVRLDIDGAALANHGFGSGTAIRLASLEALILTNDYELPKDQLIKLSGRGGTSGIGINTYFSGGAIIDLGIRNNNKTHKPSSVYQDVTPPLVFQRYEMPDWYIGICIPTNLKPLTKEQEEKFFDEVCPINEFEVYKSLYHSVMGIMASIYELDKDAFEYSIRELQKCEWKKAERILHGDALSTVEEVLYNMGASTVGMSSLGPSLFFLASDIDKVITLAKKELPDCMFLKTLPSNHGREIQCLN